MDRVYPVLRVRDAFCALPAVGAAGFLWRAPPRVNESFSESKTSGELPSGIGRSFSLSRFHRLRAAVWLADLVVKN